MRYSTVYIKKDCDIYVSVLFNVNMKTIYCHVQQVILIMRVKNCTCVFCKILQLCITLLLDCQSYFI